MTLGERRECFLKKSVPSFPRCLCYRFRAESPLPSSLPSLIVLCRTAWGVCFHQTPNPHAHMKLNTERIHTIWHLTWPQCIMLLCQFVIGITDVWAGGRIGSEVQASIGLITQCHMMFMALAMAAVSGAVASISQSLGACKFVRARRYVGS